MVHTKSSLFVLITAVLIFLPQQVPMSAGTTLQHKDISDQESVQEIDLADVDSSVESSQFDQYSTGTVKDSQVTPNEWKRVRRDVAGGSQSQGRGRGRKYYQKKVVKVIPADRSLLHESYSNEAETRLGQTTIEKNRRKRGWSIPGFKTNDNKKNKDSKGVVVQGLTDSELTIPVPIENPSSVGKQSAMLVNERVHDIEEIFHILARRDGQFLKQMLNLKAAIDRTYSIFEFLGVANMPQDKRDEAIHKVLLRTLNIDSRKPLLKKRRRRRKFAN